MIYFKNKPARHNHNLNCYVCNSELIIKSGYKYNNIIKCSNENCNSNTENGFKYKRLAFYDKDLIKKMGKEGTWKKSPVSLDYWIDKGFSEIEAIEKRKQWNQENQWKRDKSTFLVNSYDIKHYMNRGFSEEDAKIEIEKRKRVSSHFCIEYWLNKGFTENEAKEKIHDIQSINSKKRTPGKPLLTHPISLSYWLNKYENDIELANVEWKNFCKISYGINSNNCKDYDKMMENRKNTWNKKTKDEKNIINKSRGKTLEQLTEKHGFDKANEIINLRCKAFRDKNWSKVSFEMFSELEKQLNINCFYGSNEKHFNFNGKSYYVDFWDGDKFIIEFQGDIFHANSMFFDDDSYPNPFNKITAKELRENDLKRKKIFEENGYTVLWVWENDYNKNKTQIINNLISIYEENHKIN